MNHSNISESMQPVAAAERYAVLDVLRGAALLGVLLINLHVGFRVSLFTHILNFHTHAGRANRATDFLLAWVFEFKAFTLFSLLFGVGVGVQAERAAKYKRGAARFLARRFAMLLIIGLGHMLFIWNGDILILYAVCGLLLIPFITMSARWLAAAGFAVIVVSPYLPFFDSLFPSGDAMRVQADVATRVYATGSFAEILFLRVNETVYFIAPLLLSSLPRTFGLMLLGIAAWRWGVLQRPGERHKLLQAILIVAGGLGALTTTFEVWSKETGRPPPGVLDLLYPYSIMLLAFAYGAGFLLCFSSAQTGCFEWLARLLAAAGRMALSNYLAQSLIFSLVFYGFGIGLFGRLGSAVAVLLGLAVFAGQLVISEWWLRRFCFGPMEWVWRSLTYGHWQSLRRTA